MRFLQAIKQLRKTRGLTQGELADLAGIDQARISKIEAGAANIEASTLASLASALDVEIVLVPRRVLAPVKGLIENHLNQANRSHPARPLTSIRDELFIPDEVDDETIGGPKL